MAESDPAQPSRYAENDEEDEPVSSASDPLELFFDLVFVFAFTRVTAFVAANHTWAGVVRGLGLLAALWWAWVTYTWLMDTTDAQQRLAERVAIFAATALVFVVALAVPGAFGGTAVLFGVTYFAVRALHVGLSVVTAEPGPRARFLELAPGFLGGPALLLVAGLVGPPYRIPLWVLGIGIDYGVLFVRGVAKFEVHAEHFVERYRDIVLIAHGEVVLAMGFSIADSGSPLTAGVVLAALLGIVLLAALSWLYFDYVTFAAEAYLVGTEGYERGAVARDSYAYLHFPMVAGVVAVAFGLEEAVLHLGEPLGPIAAGALLGGAALYLLGHTAFRLYEIGSVSVPRLVVAGLVFLAIAVTDRVSALVALAALTALFVALAAFETLHSRIRPQVRED